MSNKMEKIGERLHEVMGWWEHGTRTAKMGFLERGKAIYYLKKEKLWRIHTEHMPSFKYWVEHTLHISKAQANREALIYIKVGKILENIEIDISKVTLLLPHLEGKTEEGIKDMLNMAKDCTVEDIRNNLREMTGEKEATDVCLHAETELYERCKKCGKWLK